jgi:hypothetical protein
MQDGEGSRIGGCMYVLCMYARGEKAGKQSEGWGPWPGLGCLELAETHVSFADGGGRGSLGVTRSSISDSSIVE